MYNLTNLTTGSGVGQIGGYLNEVTSGSFWTISMIAIFIIMVLILKRYSLENALFVSSWACFILTLILATVGWVNIFVALTFLALAGISGLYIYMNGGF